MSKPGLSIYNCFIYALVQINESVLNELMKEVIELNRTLIKQLQQQQLYDGFMPDGSEITPDYTDYTIELKEAKGQKTDNVTLRDKGELYESIFETVAATYFDIEASDRKTGELKDKYGEFLGLNQDSKDDLISVIKPQFIERLRSRIGL